MLTLELFWGWVDGWCVVHLKTLMTGKLHAFSPDMSGR